LVLVAVVILLAQILCLVLLLQLVAGMGLEVVNQIMVLLEALVAEVLEVGRQVLELLVKEMQVAVVFLLEFMAQVVEEVQAL